MKKIFIAIAALAAITFASSCNGTTGQGGENDSTAIDTVVVEETNVVEAQEKADALISDITQKVQAGNTQNIVSKIEEAAIYIQELVKDGDKEAVKAYIEKLKAFAEANKEKLEGISTGNTNVEELINGVINNPQSLDETITKAAEAIGMDAEAAKQAAQDAAKSISESAKAKAEEKANEAVNAAKAKAEEKVNTAVEDAKNKAYEKGKEAGENAKKALNNAADEAKKKLGF